MPGFTTHYLFGQQTYPLLPTSNSKKAIQKYPRVYTLGLQGPDIFFYHTHRQNPGSIAHTTNTGMFLSHLLQATEIFPSAKEQTIAQSYVLGFVGHYILDSTCHPYIYARSNYSLNKKRNMGRHIQLETDIDNSLLWFYQRKRPSEFHQSNSIALNKEQIQVISKLLFIAFKKTYPNLMLSQHQIKQSILSTQKITRILYDTTGCKKAFIQRLESIFLSYPMVSSLIANDHLVFYKDPCNIRHKSWKNPWDESILSRESFFDLFEKAQTQYFKLLIAADKYFSTKYPHGQKEDFLRQLQEQLGNFSYHSGLPSASYLV